MSNPHQTAALLEGLLKGFYATLSPAARATLAGVSTTIQSNPQAAIRTLWGIAVNSIKDPKVLRIALNFARPGLGVLGVGAAEIEVAVLGLTGMSFAAIGAAVMNVLFYICVAVIVIMLVLLAIWLISKLFEFVAWLFKTLMSWNPGANRAPTPMQTPQWGRLLNVLHDPGVGPLYAIEEQAKPCGITFG